MGNSIINLKKVHEIFAKTARSFTKFLREQQCDTAEISEEDSEPISRLRSIYLNTEDNDSRISY